MNDRLKVMQENNETLAYWVAWNDAILACYDLMNAGCDKADILELMNTNPAQKPLPPKDDDK